MNFFKLSNKKVGILGIGYLGSNILEYLKKLNLNIDLIPITRENVNSLEEIEFDYLINSAGNSGDFRNQIFETIESNLDLNCFILKKAKIKESYIYISSTRVYGFSDKDNIVFDEKSVTAYNNLNLDFIYGGSKQLAESLLFNYAKNVNYKIGILRLSNVYGNFDMLDDSTLIKKILRYKEENKNDFYVNQNRYSTKDYIYIQDAIENTLTIMLNLKKTDVYNVSYGKSYSIDYISKILNMKIRSNETIPSVYSNVSNGKMIKEFGIQAKNSLENKLK